MLTNKQAMLECVESIERFLDEILEKDLDNLDQPFKRVPSDKIKIHLSAFDHIYQRMNQAKSSLKQATSFNDHNNPEFLGVALQGKNYTEMDAVNQDG